MRKSSYRILGLAVLAFSLVLLPAAAQAKMWVGLQLGANFMGGTDIKFDGPATTGKYANAQIEPSVIGGLTIGYDFVKEGFLGYNYPDWMKHFSFALDFTYNRMDFRQQQCDLTVNGVNFGKQFLFGSPGTSAEGYMAVLTFLFMGHYGFLPDSEVPYGRLIPYVGVGPGIVFSGTDFGDFGLGNSSSANVALVVEAGIRYMALKNVSLDCAFRYRYAAPSYSFTDGANNTWNVKINADSYTALFRASYHF